MLRLGGEVSRECGGDVLSSWHGLSPRIEGKPEMGMYPGLVGLFVYVEVRSGIEGFLRTAA